MNTEYKTQNNSLYSSDDDNKYKIPIEMIYHVDPEGVIKLYPDLEGKVFQAYLLCNLCHEYKKMTPTNSYCIPLSDRSFSTQLYTGQHVYCMEPECERKYEEKMRSINRDHKQVRSINHESNTQEK